MREYGRLKVIGTTPKQIRRIVRREGLLLSLCGIPLGLLVGGAIGFAISRHIGAGWAICPIWLRPQQPAP